MLTSPSLCPLYTGLLIAEQSTTVATVLKGFMLTWDFNEICIKHRIVSIWKNGSEIKRRVCSYARPHKLNVQEEVNIELNDLLFATHRACTWELQAVWPDLDISYRAVTNKTWYCSCLPAIDKLKSHTAADTDEIIYSLLDSGYEIFGFG